METVEYKGHCIEIYIDEYAENPRRAFDNLGRMTCWHRRYDLGDKHSYKNAGEFFRSLAMEADDTVESRLDYWEDGDGWARLAKKYKDNPWEACGKKVETIIMNAVHKNYILLPLYLYDHSVLILRAGEGGNPFIGRAQHAEWDSGQVGWAYMSKKYAMDNWGKKRFTRTLKEKSLELLRGEVEEYGHYLSGEVYGFKIIDGDGNEIDSCWGWYVDPDRYLVPEAKSVIDRETKRKLKAKSFNRPKDSPGL
jgi:hypothetical protein